MSLLQSRKHWILPVSGEAGNGAWDEVVGGEGGDGDHCEAAVLKLPELHLPTPALVFGVGIHPIDDRLSVSSVRLTIEGRLVFKGLDGAAKDDELGPPLRIGLHNGVHSVSSSDVLRVEGSEVLGPAPSYDSEHGGAGIGEFGLPGPLGRHPLAQAPWIELWRRKQTRSLGEQRKNRSRDYNHNMNTSLSLRGSSGFVILLSVGRRRANALCHVFASPPPLTTLGTKLTNLLPVSTSMPTRSSYPSGMEALRAVGDLPVRAGAKAAAEPTRAAVIAAAVFMVATRIDCGKKKGEGG